MTTYDMTAKPGDRLTWLRQSEALKCVVIETTNGGHRAHLRIEGWASTQWETLDTLHFYTGHDWRVKGGELRQIEPSA